jgi:hypothetical protein
MKTLKRNQTTIYYANYIEADDLTVTDEYGNPLKSGEKGASYSEPTAIDLVVSPASGRTMEEMFGDLSNYDRVLMTEKGCEINEHSRLWIDVPITEPHDYIVKRAARSLNFVAYAVSKVEVSDGN